MARIAVVGTGYVGTVTAVCFAWLGHSVQGIDALEPRVTQLAAGQVPFYEPGLDELLADTLETGRLSFTSDMSVGLSGVDVVFLCVGTPIGEGGLPDLSQVEGAVRAMAPHLPDGAIVANKSTVPVGSGNWLRSLLQDLLSHRSKDSFFVVSNPEFLREACAIHDFLHPDRIVLGGEAGPRALVASLYGRLLTQDFPGGRREHLPELIVTDLPSAELVKYASNAFLASKISFANEIAAVCELVGADVRQVLPAIGADERIGRQFLQPGLGWGGSCFGKDVAALIETAREYGQEMPILRATVEVNRAARAGAFRKLQQLLKLLKGRRIAVLGLAFKPGTDDLRDAPALDLLRRLRQAGAVVSAHDPVVKNLPAEFADVRIGSDAYDTARRADAVVLVTDWPEYAALDLEGLAAIMNGTLLLDGRNALDADAAATAGLNLVGFGW